MDILLTLGAFALVSSLTPGPNNLMLMSSGATYGMRRTVPHMLGVSLGFTFMVLLVGIGIVQVFDLYPLSYTLLKWLSVAYLLFLAYKIAVSSSQIEEGKRQSKPFTFFQAASFQWVNPKAWTMALSAISIYAPSKDLNSVALVAVVFGLINFPSITVWTAMGQTLQRVLNNTKRLKLFNYFMATLLVMSLYPVFFPDVMQ